MRDWDVLDWLGATLLTVLGILILLLGYVVIIESSSEKITLTKSKWACVDEKAGTQFMMAGKVMVPITRKECIKYEKIGETK